MEHRIYAGEVTMRYQRRIWLLLLGWPKLFLFALSSAAKSLGSGNPPPDAVVLGSDIEVIVFGILRSLLRKKGTKIILLGFIFTHRSSNFVNRLRHMYFAQIFKIADAAICHSVLEVERYRALFAGSRATFHFVPYGLHIDNRKALMNAAANDTKPEAYILAAGRSGRDYSTLAKAAKAFAAPLHVICDNDSALDGVSWPENVSLLRNCYGDDYTEELARAYAVVIPLLARDISAGQMVLIQSMGLGLPVIVTDTPTVREYVENDRHVLMVPQEDPQAIWQALERLRNEYGLREKLSKAAEELYLSRFCMRAYVGNILSVTQKLC